MTKDEGRVRDMIAWAQRAIGYLGVTSEADYLDNTLLQNACERCIEVVGEAAGSISEPFRLLHPDVSWKQAKGMRNILIHQYGAVVQQTVYQTVRHELPVMVVALKKVLGE